MGDSYVSAVSQRCEFPADNSATLGIIVPIANPGIDKQTRGIEFEDLAMALERTDAIDHDGSAFCCVGVLASWTGIHFPGLHRTLGIAEPVLELASIGECLEDAVGRSCNVDLTDDRVLVGCDKCGGHKVSRVISVTTVMVPTSRKVGETWGTQFYFAALGFAVEIKEFFVFLAVICERPLFCMVIVVDQGQHHFVHMRCVGRSQVHRINKTEGNDLSISRD